MPERYLRVACAQFCPTFKDPSASIKRADELTSRLQPGEVDLLVLPEMAFTGYCFKSREDVEPFVEDARTGVTASWAKKTAQRLGCYVLVGLPTTSTPTTSASPATSPSPSLPPFYNALIVVSPTGELLHVYAKHFLYETDESWATAGPSFQSFSLPFPPSSPFSAPDHTFRLAPAICMDLNPYRFTAPCEAFEFGTFAAQEKVDIVVASMAWLDSEPPNPDDKTVGMEEEDGNDWERVKRTLGYWVMRVDPLLDSGAALVCANRVGREGETVFTGSSCAIELGDRPTVVGYANKRREELLTTRVRLPARD
ncbi:hypothetical protein JCM6882_006302 [Rhodosporidiobolus microsporus]